MYPTLLEKAVAVVCGGFDYIDGNQPTFALGMLTGCDQVFHYTRDPLSNTWTGAREEFTEDCCPTYTVEAKSYDKKKTSEGPFTYCRSRAQAAKHRT